LKIAGVNVVGFLVLLQESFTQSEPKNGGFAPKATMASCGLQLTIVALVYRNRRELAHEVAQAAPTSL
jgi:hypothetical protein